MNFVLDTNVVSEAIKSVPDPTCFAWLHQHVENSLITTVTLGELRYGVERLPEGKRKRDLGRKLDFVWEDFGERILDFDSAAAAEFGRYVAEVESAKGAQAVESGDVRDFQIAAIARAHGFAVASRNTRHFAFIRCVNPFLR
jgi:predicted nucleic acid-binding protein